MTSTRHRLTPEEVEAIWGRFERRETSLREERERFGFSTNVPLRKALQAYAGRTAYRAAIFGTCKRGRKPKPAPVARRQWNAPPEPTPESEPIIEVPTRGPRLVLVQRIGHLIRLTTAERVTRTQSDALRIGGTVLIPATHLAAVWTAVRKAARKRSAPIGD